MASLMSFIYMLNIKLPTVRSTLFMVVLLSIVGVTSLMALIQYLKHLVVDCEFGTVHGCVVEYCRCGSSHALDLYVAHLFADCQFGTGLDRGAETDLQLSAPLARAPNKPCKGHSPSCIYTHTGICSY